MKKCHACGRELPQTTKIGRRDVCSFCSADLHCCLNCSFYETKASRQCREPMAEPVKEKGRANFCDYFVFRESGAGNSKAEADNARKELENLFKR